MRPYASYTLFLAEEMERQNRHDSADARRIHVLKSVDPESIGEQACKVLALTAANYSFPEASSLLELFNRRFPQSDDRPEVLLELAKITRSEHSDTRSRGFLEEIREEWPDSTAYPKACILLAGWLQDDGLPRAALNTITDLLDRGDLSPHTTAQAILHRAELLFLAGESEKGSLNCQRILHLYPAFHDIIESAKQLLEEQMNHEV